jgi:ribosomal protein S18 acetylase RimI-like enzyme
MDNQNGELLRLTPKERDGGAGVVGRAFAEYDLFRYYYPDEGERRAAAHTYAFVSVSVCLKYGEVYASSDKLEGVAAWLPPGKSPFGLGQVVRTVPLPVLARFARQGAGRMLTYGRYVDGLHRRVVPYPHWYLEIIGVDPPCQGQGVCSRLLRPMLERIDRERMPCYLETNAEKNAAIYRRFGFEVVSQEKLPGTPVTTFAMLRKAQTA